MRLHYVYLGIHPTSISEAFQKAAAKSLQILEGMTTPLDLNDRESLLKSASTSLNSKVRQQPLVADKLNHPCKQWLSI